MTHKIYMTIAAFAASMFLVNAQDAEVKSQPAKRRPAAVREVTVQGYQTPAKLKEVTVQGYQTPAKLKEVTVQGYQTPAKLKEVTVQGYQTPARKDTIKTVLKDLGFEVPTEKGSVLHIRNGMKNLDIRAWDQDKVRFETKVMIAEGEARTIKEAEILEQSGVNLRTFGNRVELTVTMPAAAYASGNWGGVEEIVVTGYSTQDLMAKDRYEKALSGTGSSSGSAASLFETRKPVKLTGTRVRNEPLSPNYIASRTMVVYVPRTMKLDIDNRRSDIIINSDINEAEFKLDGSNLDARNFEKLKLNGKSCNINIGSVNEADLDLTGGSLTAGVITVFDLESSQSEIDYEGGTSLFLNSANDHIILDEIGSVAGTQNFGDLRIGKLSGALDINGRNTDIKIRSIAPTTTDVRVRDQFATLRMRLKDLKNFEIQLQGDNASVFAPTQKDGLDMVMIKSGVVNTGMRPTAGTHDLVLTPITAGMDDSKPIVKNTKAVTPPVQQLELIIPAVLIVNSGDVKGPHTKFSIQCNNCSIDLK